MLCGADIVLSYLCELQCNGYNKKSKNDKDDSEEEDEGE